MDAIILGVNHHNTYGIIRALHRIEVYPIVITPPLNEICCYKGTRYIKQLIEIPTEKVLDFLIQRGYNLLEKDTIFVSSDYFSNLIDQNCEVLSKYYNISGAKGKLSHYMDKQMMGKTAEQSGLNIPPNSAEYKSRELMKLAHLLHYPLIVKPYKSIAGSKSDIFIARDQKEFEKVVPQLKCDTVQIQDFIEKKFEYQLIGLSLSDGQVIIPGITRLLWASSPRTNTGIVRTLPLNDEDNIPIEAVTRFIHKIGYVGLFSVEFLRDHREKDFFMEINFRNDGNAIVMTYSGVNLPGIWWNYFASEKRKISADFKSATAIPLRSMLSVARSKKRMLKLLKYCIRPHVFMDLDFYDMHPLCYQIKSKLKHIFQD